MKYSNYDIQENEDGTFTAFEEGGNFDLATARHEAELESLMAKLDKAYEDGVKQGIKEHKEEMRNKLGL